MSRQLNRDKVILFDISGVLVELGGMSDFVKWTGRSADEVLSQWLTSESARAFESGRINFDEFYELFIDEWKVDISKRNLSCAFKSWVKKAYPGALDLLDALNGQYTLACLTNTNSIQWPVVQETIKAKTFFKHQFVSHLMGRVKPDAETYEYVLEQMCISGSDIVFFDDSNTNVSAAIAVGMQAYQVKGVSGIRNALRDIGLI